MLLWKKSATLSEIFRGGNNFKFFLNGTFFSVTLLQPQCRGETCVWCPGATAELCVSCKGRCSGHAPAAPQQNFEGLVQLGLGSRLGVWIQDQLLLPSFCLNWVLVLLPPAWLGADVSGFSPLVLMAF